MTFTFFSSVVVKVKDRDFLMILIHEAQSNIYDFVYLGIQIATVLIMKLISDWQNVKCGLVLSFNELIKPCKRELNSHLPMQMLDMKPEKCL